jgi:hypothetical protein
MLNVCQNDEVVTRCEFCQQPFTAGNKRHRFCRVKCRVDAHRQPQRDRRNRWTEERMKYRAMEFDGRYNGSINHVGPLSQFEKRPQEVV